MDKLRKEKAKGMVEHVTKCHKTKLKLNKEPYSGWLAGGRRARKAMIGRATKIRQFLTMNSDYIEYPGETDNNGHTKVYHSVVLPDLVGEQFRELIVPWGNTTPGPPTHPTLLLGVFLNMEPNRVTTVVYCYFRELMLL